MQDGSILAHASYCYQDERGRPVAGYTNVCPQSMSRSTQDRVEMVREYPLPVYIHADSINVRKEAKTTHMLNFLFYYRFYFMNYCTQWDSQNVCLRISDNAPYQVPIDDSIIEVHCEYFTLWIFHIVNISHSKFLWKKYIMKDNLQYLCCLKYECKSGMGTCMCTCLNFIYRYIRWLFKDKWNEEPSLHGYPFTWIICRWTDGGVQCVGCQEKPDTDHQ